jgi:Zn-dependent M28 family amino/carboxypeptidase
VTTFWAAPVERGPIAATVSPQSTQAAPAIGVRMAPAIGVRMAPADGREALRAASRVASLGPRPAASGNERRAHDYVRRVFEKAGLKVAVQPFAVPGKGSSRNVIGLLDTPRDCLRIVMAHTDTTAPGPGANDNASGVGVVVALAGRLRRIRPRCDVWLVATGAEERIYTGQPDHLGALALARRARALGAARRLRYALSLDEVGRDRPFWLRSPAPAPRRGVERALLRAADRAGIDALWVRDGSDSNSDHREFELLGLPAAKLGVGAGGEPCRHMACDTPDRLDRRSLALAQRLAEQALRAD